MAGDPEQKNKPELLCGVAPRIADGSVTGRVEQPPPGVLPEGEERPHRASASALTSFGNSQ